MGVRPNTIRVHEMWFTRWNIWRNERAYSDELHSVTSDELIAFLLYLREEHQVVHGRKGVERLSPYSILSAWRSLRALWTYLGEEGLVQAAQMTFFPRRVPMPRVDEEIRPTYSNVPSTTHMATVAR